MRLEYWRLRWLVGQNRCGERCVSFVRKWAGRELGWWEHQSLWHHRQTDDGMFPRKNSERRDEEVKMSLHGNDRKAER